MWLALDGLCLRCIIATRFLLILIQVLRFSYEFLEFLQSKNNSHIQKEILTLRISLLIATSIADLSSLLFANKYGFRVSKNFRQNL